MASPTGDGNRSWCWLETSVSAASIAARSAGSNQPEGSATQIGQLERAVGALDKPLNLCFGLGELAGGGPQTLDPFLEQGERARQIELFAFELRHDRLQSPELARRMTPAYRERRPRFGRVRGHPERSTRTGGHSRKRRR